MTEQIKVMFVNNYPTPYRVSFFNLLSEKIDLTVCYELSNLGNRDKSWKGKSTGTYTEKFLNCKPLKYGMSFGLGLVKEIMHNRYDGIILANYVSPTVLLAVCYCKLHKIPYMIEYDGGFNRRSSRMKTALKKFLVLDATHHFTTSNSHKEYLQSLGIEKDHIFIYPFSSLFESEVRKKCVSPEEKQLLKKELGLCPEKKLIISVGQFIHRKGFDILLNAVSMMKEETEVCIIGDNASEKYQNIITKLNLSNVLFLGFKQKKVLRKYYEAADVFAFPTREDMWGMVINEAMAAGLPVVTTNRCVAGLEMVKNGESGYLIASEDAGALAEKLDELLENDTLRKKMSLASIKTAKKYTFEAMADAHILAFNKIFGINNKPSMPIVSQNADEIK